jgi:hypothetical protein
VGQQGTLTTVWARTGTRPTAVKQTEYDWVYLFGAVCPATGQSSAMIAGSVGIEWMNLHLQWISEEAARGPGGDLVQVVLVLDQAGWHTSPKLKIPPNITLLHLPSYSPELNPIENLWHWLRSHLLSNRVYRDVPHLYEATDHAWNTLTPQRLSTVCRAPYMERAN